ncbi:MAG: hypothetical protein AB1414_14855 [bacterium]
MRWLIILSIVISSGCSKSFDNKEVIEDKWYIFVDKEYGPIELKELKLWCEEGRVLPDTLVKKGKIGYKLAKEFSELQAVLTKDRSQHIESLSDKKEILLIPNVTYGLQPEEDEGE